MSARPAAKLAPVSLIARGVAKRFGSTRALEGLDFDLAGGEIVGLMGANGAGKSTFVNILAGASQADDGEISLDGRPYRPLGARRSDSRRRYRYSPGDRPRGRARPERRRGARSRSLRRRPLRASSSPPVHPPPGRRNRQSLGLCAAARPGLWRHRSGGAPARGDRPRACGGGARADPRRAHRELVERRERTAVRRAGKSRRARSGDTLHFAPDPGSAPSRPSRRRAARRPIGRRILAAHRFWRGARGDDRARARRGSPDGAFVRWRAGARSLRAETSS